MPELLFFSWFLVSGTEALTVAALAASRVVPASYELPWLHLTGGFNFRAPLPARPSNARRDLKQCGCSPILMGLGHSVFRLIPRTPTILSRRASTWPDIAQ